MTINVDELERSAVAMAAADARLMEIGEGVGGLGVHHPEMLEDWRAWQDLSENSHADTVLGLIADLRAERKRADDAVASLDARWEHSDHQTAKYYRRMREAERAAADLEKAHTPTDDERETLDGILFDLLGDTFSDAVSERLTSDLLARLRAAGFRRSEVPEPSAAREFLKAALAESDADEAEGGAGWDVEVDARTVLELLDEHSEPQGEPSDAQVQAAFDIIRKHRGGTGLMSVVRDALRAAGGER